MENQRIDNEAELADHDDNGRGRVGSAAEISSSNCESDNDKSGHVESERGKNNQFSIEESKSSLEGNERCAISHQSFGDSARSESSSDAFTSRDPHNSQNCHQHSHYAPQPQQNLMPEQGMFPINPPQMMTHPHIFGNPSFGPHIPHHPPHPSFLYPVQPAHMQMNMNVNMGMMPPSLPPPPSMPVPPIINNNLNDMGELRAPSELDATRQYYEAQMREHAMQYANAAAGAAWAAAKIASGLCGSGGGNFMANQPGMFFGPNPAVSISPQNDKASSAPRQQRTLWQPKEQNRKHNAAKKSPVYESTSNYTGKHSSQLGKKRCKKRESGNDSVSSLGSEVENQDHSEQPQSFYNGGRHSGKKGGQRRRFNDDEGRESDKFFVKESNFRHKRGLHNGYSSRGSTSSPGSTNQQLLPSGRNKKKNRSHSKPETPTSCLSGNHPCSPNSTNGDSPSYIFLGGLIGKSGVSALHELCSKYRWNMPTYNLIEPLRVPNTSKCDQGTGNGTILHGTSHDFVLSVHVNGNELGRGRGGTKAAAKQDSSRKALAALVPGVVFDPNGILISIGGGSRSQPTSLEELAPHLASQLAIGGNTPARPSSPDPSEDSSISTAVSMTKMTIGSANDGEGVISGGPIPTKFGSSQRRSSGTLSTLNAAGAIGRGQLSSNIYPCASTTSGVSSASEVDDEKDENAYYASRGASVCSVLLNAMVQIDDRIREPPSYSIHICPLKNVAPGDSISEDVGMMRNGGDYTTGVAVHRPPFQCTASLTLYFPKHVVGDKGASNVLKCWESPLEYLQTKQGGTPRLYGSYSPEPRRKRKDSHGGDTTTSVPKSPTRSQRHLLGGEHTEQSDVIIKGDDDDDDFLAYKLESTGTGPTKREAKHKASAQMLSMLFPECTSLVEVKAAAEAARETYAKNRAVASKRMKRSNCENSDFDEKAHPSECKEPSCSNSQNSRGVDSNILSRFLPIDEEIPLPPAVMNRIHSLTGINSIEGPNEKGDAVKITAQSFGDNVSVANLSLSDPTEEANQCSFENSIQRHDPENSRNALELSLKRQRLFQNDVDSVLLNLRDASDNNETTVENYSRFVLHRAQPEDYDCVHTLLDRNKKKGQQSSGYSDRIFKGPLRLLVVKSPGNGADGTTPCDSLRCKFEAASTLWSTSAIILLLSRVVAAHDEPPLGCAVLILGFSLEDGRTLNICDIAYETHLPRERFLECLGHFACKMNCKLVDDSQVSLFKGMKVSSTEMKSVIQHYLLPDQVNNAYGNDHDNEDGTQESNDTVADVGSKSLSPYRSENDFSNHSQGNSLHNFLQSVKEEDSAEEDDRSEDEEKLEKSETESACVPKGTHCKPSKRSRVS
ncbi:hypothetical protein ACHAXS_007245 [Conticribra weissflogii]